MKKCWECEHRSEPDYRDPCRSCLENKATARVVIYNLRHRGATTHDLAAEIAFRQSNITVCDEKFFGYSLEELQSALTYWNEC